MRKAQIEHLFYALPPIADLRLEAKAPYVLADSGARLHQSGECKNDDFDVLCNGVVVDRIMRAAAAPVGTPWL
jgi:hypothetical protein